MTASSAAASGVRDYLSRPVSIQSLAVFRIALGALLIWDCWRFIKYDRVYRYWIGPDFHFTYPGFGWVTPLPEPWIHIAWIGVGVSALLVMLGLLYRVAIVMLTILFSYFFLLDQAEYLNHFYLVILMLILMCFMPANRAYALDARIWPGIRSQTVSYASVFMLRAQMEIMLIFAGLVKITPDWLAGEPLGLWLRRQSDEVPLGFLLHYDWVIIAATWGTIALHVLGAPLLLWQRTRLAVFCIYCVFHCSNAFFFNIGIFPWLTIAATTIFFAPDWPQRLSHWMLRQFQDVPPLFSPPAPPARPVRALTLTGMGVWIAVQLFLPLRAGLFPTEVRWTGDGHRFSWRMRIYDRDAGGVFIVTDAESGREWFVDPEEYLSRRQTRKMIVRADLIHKFANHLEDRWQHLGYADVSVRADIRKSLNGRPWQHFIDPDVDLTAVRIDHFGPDPWVLPLEIPVWGVRENAETDSPTTS